MICGLLGRTCINFKYLVFICLLGNLIFFAMHGSACAVACPSNMQITIHILNCRSTHHRAFLGNSASHVHTSIFRVHFVNFSWKHVGITSLNWRSWHILQLDTGRAKWDPLEPGEPAWFLQTIPSLHDLQVKVGVKTANSHLSSKYGCLV